MVVIKNAYFRISMAREKGTLSVNVMIIPYKWRMAALSNPDMSITLQRKLV